MNTAEYKTLTQPKEKHIQQEIINYLKSEGWYVQRMNSGKYSVGEGRGKRFIMGSEAGTPDIMAFCEVYPDGTPGRHYLDLVFIEVKRPSKQATALQEMKMTELEAHGARCIVAHSLEELQEEL